jgi:hypothetical protein
MSLLGKIKTSRGIAGILIDVTTLMMSTSSVQVVGACWKLYPKAMLPKMVPSGDKARRPH